MSHFLCRSSTIDGYSWAVTSVTSPLVFIKGVLIKVCLRWWFYPQQARNSNAKRCMGMNVLVSLVNLWWNRKCFSNWRTVWFRNIDPFQKCVVNLFLCCCCSRGRLCWGTGTAWQWLTLGTWHSSPMTRWRPACRNSFTNLAGERELSQQGPAGRFLLTPLIAAGLTDSLCSFLEVMRLLLGCFLNVKTSCSLFACWLVES